MTSQRFQRRFFSGLVLLLGGVAPGLVYAQNDTNSPPVILGISWTIFRFNTGLQEPFNPATDLAMELDVIRAVVTVQDQDFVADTPDGTTDEGVYIRRYSIWAPFNGPPLFLTPEPPPIGEDIFPQFLPREAESGNTASNGFAPTDGSDRVNIPLQFQVPEFTDENQAKLRGLINYDVRWVMFFDVKDDAADTHPVDDSVQVFIYAIDNPSLRPPNPPPFADAGPDLTAVAGATVQLDASESFDSTNIGFDPQDPNVFAKDNITFTWEWLSGPERVDPIYRDLTNTPYLAEITLNQIGTYVYRLTVDDNVNALPSTDTVTITVVSSIPENKAPKAVISGPTAPLVINGIITLDGTGSSDPNGDPLTFRWVQTDELGNPLTAQEIAKSFQPLNGLESPIAQWQAIAIGTFYFRLIVNDSELQNSADISVQVIAAGTAGTTAQNGTADSSLGNAGPADLSPIVPTTACGGSLLPLAVLPLMLRGVRRKSAGRTNAKP